MTSRAHSYGVPLMKSLEGYGDGPGMVMLVPKHPNGITWLYNPRRRALRHACLDISVALRYAVRGGGRAWHGILGPRELRRDLIRRR